MYRNTVFGELLQSINRNAFDGLVEKHQADKWSKGFGSWDQLVSMVYAQLAGSRSLRDLEEGFNSQQAYHYHLATGPVRRSTIARNNRQRDGAVFDALLGQLMTQAVRQKRRAVKQGLRLLDSTSITLKGLGYDDWTLETKTQRTQGVKAHVMYCPQSELPLYLHVTDANINDITDAQTMTLEPGATYVFDKGYYSYDWWNRIDETGAWFITRTKKNAALKVIKSHPCNSEHDEVLADQTVQPNACAGRKKPNPYNRPLRRVMIDRPDKDTPLILITNDQQRSAREIGELYKARWQIELFFKWIKQNLKVKAYLGQSRNAVKIQITIAMITYLLVALYRANKQLLCSMRTCLIVVRETLFQRTELDVHRERRRRARLLEEQAAGQASLRL